ncbi:hypothetical protein ELI_09515 [Erythrobacter litoralis HTCC2594]|uniref:Uncharacterized protein n=1 Tax=Erythrobacter litoralis (strain HTCC2594) TaxID=314225 RepID=Q2N8J6_ERYLH|nr:hypothetical protein ELI_09515 [Erythrobacter litoralis HTCC2594]
MQHHRDPEAEAFFAAEGGCVHWLNRYGWSDEPLVTSEIELKPARLSSPITAMTRP